MTQGPSSTIERFLVSDRVRVIHETILSTPPALCAERALLVTQYFRQRENRRKPIVIQKAEALAHVLRHKRARIYPLEILVGNFSSHRVGGSLYPELHGVPVMEDLFRFARRSTNPVRISTTDRRRLLFEVLPFWLPRFLTIRAFPASRALSFIADQLLPTLYFINETGGISHFVPDYAGLLARGTVGYRQEAVERQACVPAGSPAAHFLTAILVVCDALEALAENFRWQAEGMAAAEPDAARRHELLQIASTCARVPKNPASSFHEALQSILFAQIALNLESLDNAVSPGRLDQLLWPYYERDIAAGVMDRARAFELLGCFALKLCEIIPIFSSRITRFHGGMFNGQVVVVGGSDREGRDATNDLTYLMIELMDRLRTRQPNYHARLHGQSPAAYRARIASALASGAASPAVYNDDVIVPLLLGRHMTLEDARDYATVGCVEPVAAGKSFLSTDAALFNLPLCLELALNQGRRFGRWRRVGARTAPIESCTSIEEVLSLFSLQVQFAVGRLLSDLVCIERANARWHPTPLTSMLLAGCLASGRDATEGGARYNGSGIQGVGAVEVGDSLAAIQSVVFCHRRASLADVIDDCRHGFKGAGALHARLLAAPKYGNDDPLPDRMVGRVMEIFASALTQRHNTRGGTYVCGFYSVTAHQAFGEIVGALPSGRRAGQPFSSGLSPGAGRERKGPTAALLSQAGLPLHLAANGINFNMKLAPWAARDPAWIQGLIDGGFAAGAMQIQVNVLDPTVLLEARDHPGRYPGLLVRVSGYSAYFDDLSPQMKQEIIDRTLIEQGGVG